MRRVGCVFAFAVLFALPAFAEERIAAPQQQVVRPNAKAQQQQNQAQQQAQQAQQAQRPNAVQQRIADLYVSNFISEVGLNDDQFLKTGEFIRAYIKRRFNLAQQRENLKQQLDQLSTEPNPSEDAITALVDEKTRVDRATGNAERAFLDEIRSTLTAKQIPLFYSFNHVFFDERLPNLIQRAREATAQGGQAPGRQNQNPLNARPNNPNRPANALRQNKQGQN